MLWRPRQPLVVLEGRFFDSAFNFLKSFDQVLLWSLISFNWTVCRSVETISRDRLSFSSFFFRLPSLQFVDAASCSLNWKPVFCKVVDFKMNTDSLLSAHDDLQLLWMFLCFGNVSRNVYIGFVKTNVTFRCIARDNLAEPLIANTLTDPSSRKPWK